MTEESSSSTQAETGGTEKSTNSAYLAVAQQLSRSTTVKESGEIDVLATIGGWRGLLEAVVPAAVFLVVFILTDDIWTSGLWAIGLAAVFSVIRLIQRQTLLQSITGLLGVALCVAVALWSGEGRDYFLMGFFTNAIYAVAMLISMAVRWPLMGLIYGFLRGEGIEWRKHPIRARRYQVATAFLVAMFLLRLLIQLPLYFADAVGALGTARLVMGIPLYALTLWLAWLVSRPLTESERTYMDQTTKNSE